VTCHRFPRVRLLERNSHECKSVLRRSLVSINFATRPFRSTSRTVEKAVTSYAHSKVSVIYLGIIYRPCSNWKRWRGLVSCGRDCQLKYSGSLALQAGDGLVTLQFLRGQQNFPGATPVFQPLLRFCRFVQRICLVNMQF